LLLPGEIKSFPYNSVCGFVCMLNNKKSEIRACWSDCSCCQTLSCALSMVTPSDILPFHSSTLPIFYCSDVLTFQSSTIPIFYPSDILTSRCCTHSHFFYYSVILPFRYLNLSDIVPFRYLNLLIYYPFDSVTLRYFKHLPAGCPWTAPAVSTCPSPAWLTWVCTPAQPPTPWAPTRSHLA